MRDLAFRVERPLYRGTTAMSARRKHRPARSRLEAER
jgi:hypothetical protein